ncbi:general secretion pathway protein GspK [Roseateles sp.]|uniref:general secretion pathway protein GspK n=1 Tax=Roseateles sp. TaxID=1971397 RepID=UPI0025CDE39F|nr:type II secretion system protein GspK [Roseateles sp.]MBV8033814.1 general secretion pathway protein GspK [Roseateles sp.]
MLLFVTVSLAVIALVAARFALRIEALREQAASLQGYAEARVAAVSARSMALYWLSTRPIGLASAGFLDEAPLVLDGRPYGLSGGVQVQVQDARGLLSANAPDHAAWTNALRSAGASPDDAAAMIDVLEDYTDIDNLRRLNGAEAADYLALGLQPPRNDWLLSVDEVERMLVWRRLPDVRQRMKPWLSVRRDPLFNPNTAPLELLQAIWPQVGADQWTLFQTLRRQGPFADAAAATAATGIPFTAAENLLFHASNAVRITVRAPGLPQALEYNVLLMPAGNYAPWWIHEIRFSQSLVPVAGQPENGSERIDAFATAVSTATPFPTPSRAVAVPGKGTQPAP